MKARRFDLPTGGSIPLLVSLTVLLLAVLALVSLGQIRADRKLAGDSEKAVEEFYAADMEAEKILAMLRNGLPVEGVTEKNGVYYYQCPVSENSSLFVEVKDGTWEILRWEIVEDLPGPEESK